ncbi:MAG: transposase, partial [Thiothrix sp.]|nr:transposase [Thiothrix sp.]
MPGNQPGPFRSAPRVRLFLTQCSRGKQAAATLLGTFSGYLVTDHYVAYNDRPCDKQQRCWAHLLRQFLKIRERWGQVGTIGKRLLLLGHAVFRTCQDPSDQR